MNRISNFLESDAPFIIAGIAIGGAAIVLTATVTKEFINSFKK